MIANSIFAVGALASLVAAIPMAQPYQKRDVVWETQTEVALTTIPVTVTHWLEPGETAPADAAVGKQHWGGGHKGKGHGHGNGGHGGHGKPPKPETTQEAPPPAPTTYQAPPPAPTTEQAPPPPPTTEQAPPPVPTTQQAPPPAYTPEPQPEPQPEPSQPSYGGSSGSGLTGMAAPGKSYSGDITYWTPALGACGDNNNESEPVVAVATTLYDAYMIDGNPNHATICNKYVSITGADGSKTRAKIVDRCGGCAETDLDLSPSLFKTVYPAGDGRVSGVKWAFE